MLVIVPDSLVAAINMKLDAAYAITPEAEVDREEHYKMLLSYFNEAGVLPEFSFEKTEST